MNKRFFIFLLIFLFSSFLVSAACGNSVQETGETCDGSDVGGFSCVDFGFAGGELGCRSDCQGFDTSACSITSSGTDSGSSDSSSDSTDSGTTASCVEGSSEMETLILGENKTINTLNITILDLNGETGLLKVNVSSKEFDFNESDLLISHRIIISNKAFTVKASKIIENSVNVSVICGTETLNAGSEGVELFLTSFDSIKNVKFTSGKLNGKTYTIRLLSTADENASLGISRLNAGIVKYDINQNEGSGKIAGDLFLEVSSADTTLASYLPLKVREYVQGRDTESEGEEGTSDDNSTNTGEDEEVIDHLPPLEIINPDTSPIIDIFSDIFDLVSGFFVGDSEPPILGNKTNFIVSGDPKERLDILFIPWNISNLSTLNDTLQKIFYGNESENDRDHILKYGFFVVDPFKTYKDKFNIFLLDQNIDEEYFECDIQSNPEKLPIRIHFFCNTNKVKASYNKFNPDYIVVMGELPKYYTSSGGEIQYLNINDSHLGETFIHEFGHQFGGLIDEYTVNSEAYERIVGCKFSEDSSCFENYDTFLKIYPNADTLGCPKWCSSYNISKLFDEHATFCNVITNETECNTISYGGACTWYTQSHPFYGTNCIPTSSHVDIGIDCSEDTQCILGNDYSHLAFDAGPSIMGGNFRADFTEPSKEHLTSILECCFPRSDTPSCNSFRGQFTNLPTNIKPPKFNTHYVVAYEKIVGCGLEYASPAVSITNVPESGQAENSVDLSISCVNNAGDGDCNGNSYAFYVSDTEIESCPSVFEDYDLKQSSITITQDSWICAYAEDNEGNQGFSEIVRIQVVDTTPPNISITNVPESGPVEGPISLGIECEDESGCNESSYAFHVADVDITSCPTNLGAYGLNQETVIVRQTSWVCAYAEDNERNSAFSGPAKIEIVTLPPPVVDSTPPAIDITYTERTGLFGLLTYYDAEISCSDRRGSGCNADSYKYKAIGVGNNEEEINNAKAQCGNTDGYSTGTSFTVTGPIFTRNAVVVCGYVEDNAENNATDNDVIIKEAVRICGDWTTQDPNDNGESEQCDEGDFNGVVCNPEYDSSCNYCASSCELITLQGPFCGDSVVDSEYGEQCDDGNNDSGDGCNESCRLESSGGGSGGGGGESDGNDEDESNDEGERGGTN